MKVITLFQLLLVAAPGLFVVVVQATHKRNEIVSETHSLGESAAANLDGESSSEESGSWDESKNVQPNLLPLKIPTFEDQEQKEAAAQQQAAKTKIVPIVEEGSVKQSDSSCSSVDSSPAEKAHKRVDYYPTAGLADLNPITLGNEATDSLAAQQQPKVKKEKKEKKNKKKKEEPKAQAQAQLTIEQQTADYMNYFAQPEILTAPANVKPATKKHKHAKVNTASQTNELSNVLQVQPLKQQIEGSEARLFDRSQEYMAQFERAKYLAPQVVKAPAPKMKQALPMNSVSQSQQYQSEFQQQMSSSNQEKKQNYSHLAQLAESPFEFLHATKSMELFNEQERQEIVQLANAKFPNVFPVSSLQAVKFTFASSLWVESLRVHVTVVRLFVRGGNSLLYATAHDSQWKQVTVSEGITFAAASGCSPIRIPDFLPIAYKQKTTVEGGEAQTRGPANPRIFLNERNQLCVAFSMLVTRVMTRMCLFNFYTGTFKCFFSNQFPDFQPQKNWSPIVFGKKTWFLYDYHKFKVVDVTDNQNVSFVTSNADSLFFSELRGGSPFQWLGNDLYLGFATMKTDSGKQRPRLVLVYIPENQPTKAHVIRMSGPLEFKCAKYQTSNLRSIVATGISKLNKKTDSITVNVTFQGKAVFVFEVAGIGKFISEATLALKTKSASFQRQIEELWTCAQLPKPKIIGQALPLNVHNVKWGSCGTQTPFADYDFYVAALPSIYMRNKTQDGFLCGKHYWVEVMNPTTGKSIKAKVADTCKDCKETDLKLSQKAYAKIGGKYTEGQNSSSIDVVWRILYQ